MKRWQGSQGRIKGCERERLREEKVQSIIRKLKNFVSEDEEELGREVNCRTDLIRSTCKKNILHLL